MSLLDQDIALRMAVALLVGSLLGWERSRAGKPAGIRTHSLVCLSSTAVTVISAYGFAGFPNWRIMDPARLIVGIITGIGFLGAGIIWKKPAGDVRGLTTAATIWTAAVLGIAIGLGHFFLAAITVVLVEVALRVSPLLRKVNLHRPPGDDGGDD